MKIQSTKNSNFPENWKKMYYINFQNCFPNYKRQKKILSYNKTQICPIVEIKILCNYFVCIDADKLNNFLFYIIFYKI